MSGPRRVQGHANPAPEVVDQLGRIVPAVQSLEDRLQAMAQAGLVLWSGRKLEAILWP